MLDSFFADVSVSKTECTKARYSRVHAALVRYLDRVDLAVLGPDSARIVAAEREFNPAHALIRVLTCEDLLFLLLGFVDDSQLPARRADARSHISLTDRLVGHLIRFRLVDEAIFSAQIFAIQKACVHARERMRHDVMPTIFG